MTKLRFFQFVVHNSSFIVPGMKGRFLNQKLGKRTSRRFALLKKGLAVQQPSLHHEAAKQNFPKKAISPKEKPAGP